MPGQRHCRYTVQEVLKKLKCLPADESDGEKDSDGLDSGSEADFDDTYSDDSVDDNHSSDSSCTANFLVWKQMIVVKKSTALRQNAGVQYHPVRQAQEPPPRQGPHHLMIHMSMKARKVNKKWVMILLPCSRRWPFQVFCNALDVAGINAHVIYKIAYGSSQSKRMFLLDLVNELVAPLCARAAALQSLAADAPVLAKRVKCSRCKKNLTAKCCNKCTKPVCGKCTLPMHVCAKC